MKQARRTNRRTSPDQRIIKHSLREIVLFFFFFAGVYLFVSLFTYSAQDFVWSSQGEIREVINKGGVAGALFADMFIYLFGYFAYLFPIMVGYLGWLIYRGRHRDILAEPKSLVVPGIGFILTLSAGCGLAIVHFAAESALLPTHAGGILGIVVGKSLEGIFSQLGATLLLIALFFTGVTLLTGLSWLKLMDILGFHTLRWSPVVQEYATTQLLPVVMYYTRLGLAFLKKILALFLKQLRGRAKATYASWQERQAEWRARREYLEDDDYFIEDDPLLYDDDDEEPQQLKTKPVIKDEIVDDENTVIKEELVQTVNFEPLLPSLNLLEPVPDKLPTPDPETLTQLLTDAFNLLQIEVTINAVHPGPVLTGFEVEPITPIKTTDIEEVSELLAQHLNVSPVRIIETKPRTLGIEMPNPQRQPIFLRELLNSIDYQDSFSPLTVALGKDMTGQPVVVDLTRIPHILMAGHDPNEKTMAIHTLLLSLIYKTTPMTLRLLLVDNATGELAVYDRLPHLLTPIISEPEQVLLALQWCDNEMERRYRLMSSKGMRNIENYNQTLLNPDGQAFLEDLTANEDALPYIIVVIHEIAEIIKTPDGTQIEEIITHLAQRARAAGIHLILATQYPSVNVITGLLKTNMPTRIAFQVETKSESRAILGQMGAEILLGEGDMLYMTAGTGMPARVHGSFVSVSEVAKVVADLKARGKTNYINLSVD